MIALGTAEVLQIETLVAGASKDSVNVCELFGPLAVSTADWLAVTVPDAAVKVAELLPCGMLTEDGTVRVLLLLPIDTETFPVAGLVSVTVQEVEAPDDKLLGEQPMLESRTGVAEGGAKLNVLVLLTLPAFAVSTAVCAPVTFETATEKAADVLPCGTATLEGTFRFELLLEILTAVPPAGAVPDRLTVQEEDPELEKLVGEQESPDSTGAVFTIEIEPPVPVVATPSPVARAETGLVTWTATLESGGAVASWKVTAANVPAEIAVVFSP